jgi:hypothetical protein
MFRELLESNGVFEHNVKLIAYIDDYQRAFLEYSCVEFKKSLVEQACMQYCIENGVKLEWLKFNPTIKSHKFNDWIYQNDVPKLKIDKVTKQVKEIFADEKGTLWGTQAKLFAAIFAHEIKIIAT